MEKLAPDSVTNFVVGETHELDPLALFGILPQESSPNSIVTVSSIDREKRVITFQTVSQLKISVR